MINNEYCFHLSVERMISLNRSLLQWSYVRDVCAHQGKTTAKILPIYYIKQSEISKMINAQNLRLHKFDKKMILCE